MVGISTVFYRIGIQEMNEGKTKDGGIYRSGTPCEKRNAC